MSEPDFKPPYRLIYVGLAVAVLAQLAIIAMWIEGKLDSVIPVGNATAAVVCLGTIWLIRQRERGRL